MPLVMDETLRDASLYAALAVLLALLALLAPPERRRGLLPMAALALASLAALWMLARFGAPFDERTLHEVVREGLLALLAVAVTRTVLGFVTRVLLARFGIPSIVSDVLLGLVLIVYALVRLNATGVNIAGIVTTSAVITGAIAFSAQEVLGALWAGLALQADRTLRIGDWIRFDERNGRIVGIRWRTTTIHTSNNETLIIPNASLIKDKVHVLARAGSTECALREIDFSVAYAEPPGRVIATVLAALRRATVANVAAEPPLHCVCTKFGESGIDYQLIYPIVDLQHHRETKSELHALLYAALHRAGMAIPFPQRDVHVFQEAGADELRRRELDSRLRALAGVELFASLTEPERKALAGEVRPGFYAHGETLFRQGEPADSLYVLSRGRLVVLDERDGARRQLATLDAPAYVGEMGLLTGQPRAATVVADGEAECLRLDKAGFDAILRNRPDVVEELSQVLARRQEENEATLQALGAAASAADKHGRVRDLVRRIRKFFALGAGGRDGARDSA